MKDNYKKILKIWLILYLIFTVFKIINTFDDSLLKSVFSIGTYPLQITSIILFVFVASRGEEKISKYGIISVIVFFAFYVLYKLSVYDLGVSSLVSFPSRICSIIYYTSNNCISILEYMAIFSLIKGNDKIEKYKKVALACIVGFALINLINNLIPSTKGDFLTNIRYCLDYISTLAKYAAIIFYLTDEGYIPKLFTNDNSIVKESSQNSMNENQNIQQTILETSSNSNPSVEQVTSQSTAVPVQQTEQSSTTSGSTWI